MNSITHLKVEAKSKEWFVSRHIAMLNSLTNNGFRLDIVETRNSSLTKSHALICISRFIFL